MECSFEWGTVKLVQNFLGRQELVVQIGLEQAKALNYPKLTGTCQPGDKILLNTTAESLRLGTGGWHYVLAIYGRERSLSKQGHIMKLRYTPLQGRILSVEEENGPFHRIMAEAKSLEGMPVAVGGLHSMLAPLVWTIKQKSKKMRLVYLMSDGGALPLGFSRIAEKLQTRGLIHKTITFGHAFGGDLEAVNIYSALLAAKHVLKADLAIVIMGPGVVGTKTTWGTTAIEQGIFLNAVLHLKGTAIAIPRLSEADQRPRHQGISHHTQTVLTQVVQERVYLPLPECLKRLISEETWLDNLQHTIVWEDTEENFKELFTAKLPFFTMGRSLKEDSLFFHGVLASAQLCVRLHKEGAMENGGNLR